MIEDEKAILKIKRDIILLTEIPLDLYHNDAEVHTKIDVLSMTIWDIRNTNWHDKEAMGDRRVKEDLERYEKRRTLNEEDSLLTEREQDQVMRYYQYGWSFQEIVERLLDIRNEKIRRDMVREVGVLVSKHYKKQAYPIEFYGKVEEEK